MIRRVVISSVTIAGKMRVFYEQGHWCQGLFFAFSFIGFLHFLLFVVLLCRMLLSTGFLYAFLMSCVGAARCRLGFREESRCCHFSFGLWDQNARSHRNTVSSQRVNMIIS
jgi:hypothetical protein